MPRGRRRKIDRPVPIEKKKTRRAPVPEVDKEILLMAIPYKVGQVVCDIKIVGIKPEGCRPIEFVYAKRGAEKLDTVRKKNVFYPQLIVRDHQGKVVWDDKGHSMTIGDFQAMIVHRREREPDAV